MNKFRMVDTDSDDDYIKKTITQKITDTFFASLDEEYVYTARELRHLITCAFNTHNIKKQVKKPKTKRNLTQYNVFVRETMIELKETNPDLPAREKMKRIGKMWRETKQLENNKYIQEDPD